PQPSAYATVLREPVDRVISLYYFHRLVQDEYGSLEGLVLPGEMSLWEFARTPPYPEADNGLVRRLSGFVGEIGGCTRDHLKEAKRRLAEFAVVGLRSGIQDTINAISRAFRVPNDQPVFTKNQNPWRPSLGAIAPSDIEQIAATNSLD